MLINTNKFEIKKKIEKIKRIIKQGKILINTLVFMII